MITSQVISSGMNEHPFGWLIAAYFFIAAIGAGLMIFTMMVYVLNLSRYVRLARLTAFITPVVAATMGLFLILELAQPLRFWRVMVNFNPASPISWGTWILNLFGVIAVVYAYAEWKGIKNWKTPLAYVGVPVAILLPLYTSFELLMTRSSPLWTSALLPVIYLVSALLAGLAIILLAGGVSQNGMAPEAGFPLARIGAHLLIGGGGLLGVQTLILFSRSPEAAIIGRNLLFGPYSAAFWGLVVLGGILLPFALLYLPATGKTRAGQVVASLLILTGIFSQRVLEIFAGMSFPQ